MANPQEFSDEKQESITTFLPSDQTISDCISIAFHLYVYFDFSDGGKRESHGQLPYK